jgi:hypothetical protein
MEKDYAPEYRTICKGKDLDAHLLECLEMFTECQKCLISYKLRDV